jgi:hypothetical protein
LGESLENLDGIVADSDEIDASRIDLVKILLQLHQLSDAKRSPIGRAVKDNGQHPIFFEQAVQVG